MVRHMTLFGALMPLSNALPISLQKDIYPLIFSLSNQTHVQLIHSHIHCTGIYVHIVMCTCTMKRLMQAQVVLSTIVVYFHNRATVHQLSKDFTRETGQLITMIQSDLTGAGEAEQQRQQNIRPSVGATHPFIPLDVLTRAHDRNHSCPEGLIPAFSNPIPYDNSTNTKIPLVIHQTFRDNCLSEDFHNLHTKWRDLGVPYYFHSDQEIERLVMSGTFEEFPQLPAIWKACITKPVVKTDFWRLLLLYEYGGIYTDLDTAPNQFRPQTHIKPDDEMYTVTDGHGCPSFHFMAAMPRHPFVFLMLQQGMMELLVMPDTGKYNPAVRTGTCLSCRDAYGCD